jgi:hypothetical protein
MVVASREKITQQNVFHFAGEIRQTYGFSYERPEGV